MSSKTIDSSSDAMVDVDEATTAEFTKAAPYFETIKSKNEYLKTFIKYERFKKTRRLTDDSEATVEAFFEELRKKYKASSLWSYYGKLRKCLMVMRHVSFQFLFWFYLTSQHRVAWCSRSTFASSTTPKRQ